MIALIVTIQVRPTRVDEFRAFARSHRDHSRAEPGCVQFDIGEDGEQFVLIERYRTQCDLDRHRSTAHYALWREHIGNFEAQPRHHQEFAVCH